MKKCPSCGMANAEVSTMCLYCLADLEKVKDDHELGPSLPDFTLFNVTGSPFMNMGMGAFANVLEESKKRRK